MLNPKRIFSKDEDLDVYMLANSEMGMLRDLALGWTLEMCVSEGDIRQILCSTPGWVKYCRWGWREDILAEGG